MSDALSVVCAVRNGEKYVYKTISQIHSMLNSNDELIIIDDNSTDQSLRKIKNTIKKLQRVKVYSNKGNGLVDALNYGISKSKNPWIARVDIDDEYVIDRFNVQKKFLEESVAAVFCDYEFIDENSNSLGIMYSPVFHEAVVISLVNSQRTPHPGVIFSKDNFLKSQKYKKEDFPVEDLSLWLRLRNKGKLVSVPEKLMLYRISPKSVTSVSARKIATLREANLQKWIKQEEDLEFSKIRNTLLKYNLIPNYRPRQILFLYDAIKFCNLRRQRILCTILWLYMFKFIFTPQGLIVTLKLLHQKKSRDKYRKSFYKDL